MPPTDPETPDPLVAPPGSAVSTDGAAPAAVDRGAGGGPDGEVTGGGSGAGRRPLPPGGPGGSGGAGPAVPRGRAVSRWLVEAVVIIALALGVTVVLRTFVAQTFYIPSGSMEPTLQIGDRILVDKLAYRLHGVGRSDIVVFARPPLEEATCAPPPVNDLVKRVVGLPGETISLSNGQVDIDGHLLPEPWLPKGTQTEPGPGDAPYNLTRPYTVPAGDYFLMGDNRAASCDSRYWGPIPRSLIVGKVDALIWPLSHAKVF